MAEPRTTREALIAEILGELDGLLARAEGLPESIAQAETRLLQTVRILDDASDKYHLAVTAFTEEAKLTLTAYVQHKAAQLVSLTIDEQRTVIQEAVAAALTSSALSRRNGLNCCDREGSVSQALSRGERLFERAVTAVLASVVTVAVLFLLRDL